MKPPLNRMELENLLANKEWVSLDRLRTEKLLEYIRYLEDKLMEANTMRGKNSNKKNEELLNG